MNEIRLPGDIDLEKLVLGSLLLDGTHMDDVRSEISGECFTSEIHCRIWRAMGRLHDAGDPIDRVTVYSALQESGEAQSVGGLSYLISLDDGLPAIPHLGSYLERLHDLASRRRLILETHKLLMLAQSDETMDVLTDAAETLGQRIALDSASGGLTSTAEMIGTIGADKLLGPRSTVGSIPLPWPALQRPLEGLHPGQLVVLMAATSRGKTSMALQIALHAAAHGHTPLIWTMEMSPRSLFRRLTNQLSGVAAARSGQLRFEEREAQRQALAMLGEQPIWFDDRSRTVGAFRAAVRRTRAKMAIVDYLQLIRGERRGGSRAQEVSDNSRSLKLAAMDGEIPIFALSQVDRSSVKGGGEIGLHSAKESGDVENDADVVAWIKCGELSRDAPTPVAIHIGKQREGPAGFDVPMVFSPQSQTFQEPL
jgi:replicative DNA helicase